MMDDIDHPFNTKTYNIMTRLLLNLGSEYYGQEVPNNTMTREPMTPRTCLDYYEQNR